MKRRPEKSSAGAPEPGAAARLVAAVAITLPDGWRYPEHAHDDVWQILLVPEGEVEATVDGVAHRAGAGEFLVYRRGARHAERLLSAGPARAVHLGFTVNDETAGAEIPVHARDVGGHAARLVDWMLERVSTRHADGTGFLDAQLALLLRELARPTRRDTLVDRVRHHVTSRLAEPLSLEVLAREAGMSRFHFARVFREACGTTPGAFVRTLRVEAARTLVTETKLPLKAIAAQTGFTDEFHLSRVFRQTLGTPPSHWRKRA